MHTRKFSNLARKQNDDKPPRSRKPYTVKRTTEPLNARKSSLQRILHCRDVEDVVKVLTLDFDAGYFQIKDMGEKIMINHTRTPIEVLLDLVGTLPIFLEAVAPFTPELFEFLSRTPENVHILSTNRQLLADLEHIFPKSRKLGLIGSATTIKLIPRDFIDFVFISYDDFCIKHANKYRESLSNLKIYVYNANSRESMQQTEANKFTGLVVNIERQRLLEETLSSPNVYLTR